MNGNIAVVPEQGDTKKGDIPEQGGEDRLAQLKPANTATTALFAASPSIQGSTALLSAVEASTSVPVWSRI